MITRSLFHREIRLRPPHGERRSPVRGPRHKQVLPRPGGSRRAGPSLYETREQVKGATASSNYWSSTTIATNPNNAWNVNFNNGNVNNTNKTNNKQVRAVRGGLWSAPIPGPVCRDGESIVGSVTGLST